MPSSNLFVCWTIDWQDNYLWESNHFFAVSRALYTHTLDLLAGKVTWYAEVDDLTDITRYPGVAYLIPEIITSGGEVGIHVHHTSTDPDIRIGHYRRAIEKIQRCGGNPTAYSAGMGNYLDADTRLLVREGIRTQRSYVGNYVNAKLPPTDWFPPVQREQIFSFFPDVTRQQVKDPAQNPVACDWRGALDQAGYTDPDDYRNVLDTGELFSVPLGILGGNEDGKHQLHIQPQISLERLRAIFNSYLARAEKETVFLACYLHPYDVTESTTALTGRMTERWRRIVKYQKECGSQFLTLAEAREVFDRLKAETDQKDDSIGG